MNLLETLDYLPRSPFETTLEKSIDDFCSGKTAMLITYSSWAKEIQSLLRDSAHNVVGIHRIPGNTSINMGWNIGLNPFTPKREEAFEFLSWLCDRNTVYYLAILCGVSPFVEPAHSHELRRLYPWMDYEKYGNLQVNQRNLVYGKRKLIIPSNKIEEVFCEAFYQIAENQIPIYEALARAQEKANKIFKSYDYPIPRR